MFNPLAWHSMGVSLWTSMHSPTPFPSPPALPPGWQPAWNVYESNSLSTFSRFQANSANIFFDLHLQNTTVWNMVKLLCTSPKMLSIFPFLLPKTLFTYKRPSSDPSELLHQTLNIKLIYSMHRAKGIKRLGLLFIDNTLTPAISMQEMTHKL